MKRYFLFILLAIGSTSCSNTWNEEDKTAFYQACMDDAKAWAGTQARAKTYCDCVFDKIQKKYPNESDALEHITDLTKDPEILQCRADMDKK